MSNYSTEFTKQGREVPVFTPVASTNLFGYDRHGVHKENRLKSLFPNGLHVLPWQCVAKG
jgi:hypothetical protein